MNRFRGWLASPRLAFWMEKLEPVLALLFIVAGIVTIFFTPYTGFNEVGQFYLSAVGLFALGFIRITAGVSLFFARVTHHVHLRQYALMMMYTSTFFTLILQIMIQTNWWRIVISVVVTAIAALEYLRFTYLTRS